MTTISSSRPSFTRTRMNENLNTPKNQFGHTIWNQENTQNAINEEDLHIMVSESGERSVKADIFDSKVMRDYIAKRQDESATPEIPELTNEVIIVSKRTIGDASSLQDFDRIMQAFNRGESIDLGDEFSEDNNTQDCIILAQTPIERPLLDTPQRLISPVPSTLGTRRNSMLTASVKTQIDTGNTILCSQKDCNTSLPLNAKYCWWCGEAQPPKFCSECGYTFLRNEKFCPDCGIAR